MIKALVRIRLRAFLAGLTAQARQKKKSSTGMLILFAFLYLYLFCVIAGMMGMTFYSLAEPYHATGLDWLYFAMAGLMGLGFSIIGGVFTTQSQIYDARDNALLLSMPIPPKAILLSRILPLLLLNLLFAGLVIVPAAVVYAIFVEFSPLLLLAQVAGLLGIVLLTQALCCVLGWLLHLLLSRMNKSIASVLYMVVFLGCYFYFYSQANTILNGMITGSGVLADILSTWVWPLYAMGMGACGSWLHLLGFLAICAGCFALAYAVLSVTFLKTATASSSSRKRRKLDLSRSSVTTPTNAIITKELRKFLSTPVYLTNMGLGLIMVIALAVAGILFRGDLLAVLTMIPELEPLVSLLICAAVCSMVPTIAISTPSVSLEGKNIWILKSMPIPSRKILEAKLLFHCRLSMPVCMLSGAALAIAYGCSVPDVILCTVIPGLIALLSGVGGMVAGLQWAKLDYISEAYPCKQSVAVLVSMFGMTGIPVIFGLIYGFLLYELLSPTVFLVLCAAVLAAVSFGLYRLMIGWGAKKWETLG